MPLWAWVLIGLFLVGLVFVTWFFISSGRKMAQVRAEILEDGEETTAWIVDVQPAEGLMWPIALVLVSPDPDVPDADMREMAARLQDLRTRRRKPASKADREAVRVTSKQIDYPGRQRLPEGFTGGWEVYSFFMDVGVEDEENLPKGALEGESFTVKLLWGEDDIFMVVPPRRRKKKSRRDDD